MITITLDFMSRGICSFTVDGHSESAPRGQDIVCAAVTAVTVGTINAMEDLTKIIPKVSYSSSGGFLRCEVPKELPVVLQEGLQILLRGFVVSLETIQRDAVDYVQIVYNK